MAYHAYQTIKEEKIHQINKAQTSEKPINTCYTSHNINNNNLYY